MGLRYCVVIDLDYTLVGVDTTAMLGLMMCSKIRRILLNLLYMTILRFVIPILNKIVTRDVYKLLLLNMCIRCDEGSLNKLAGKAYYEALNYLNTSLVKMLLHVNALKVLLTASIDVIAKRFSILGFDIVISSVTKCKDGKVWLLLDLYRKKHKVLEMLLKYCEKIIVFEDLPEQQYYRLSNVKVLKVPYHGKRW
jgi:hypothetical protein